MKHNYGQNLKKVLTSPIPVLWGIGAILLVGGIGGYFYDIDLARGNLGVHLANAELALFILFVLLFSLFVAVTVYKFRYFHKLQKQSVGAGSLGGLLGILVAGCPACSITLASYIGLASVFSLLPYNGAELKLVGILLLGYALWSSLNHLETCQRKKISIYSRLSSISIHKRIITIAILGGTFISGWSVNNYVQEQGWTTLAQANEQILVAETASIDTKKEAEEPTSEKQEDTYIPTSAPSQGCQDATGGCGCGS